MLNDHFITCMHTALKALQCGIFFFFFKWVAVGFESRTLIWSNTVIMLNDHFF